MSRYEEIVQRPRATKTCFRCEVGGLTWAWSPQRGEAVLFDPQRLKVHECSDADPEDDDGGLPTSD